MLAFLYLSLIKKIARIAKIMRKIFLFVRYSLKRKSKKKQRE